MVFYLKDKGDDVVYKYLMEPVLNKLVYTGN